MKLSKVPTWAIELAFKDQFKEILVEGIPVDVYGVSVYGPYEAPEIDIKKTIYTCCSRYQVFIGFRNDEAPYQREEFSLCVYAFSRESVNLRPFFQLYRYQHEDDLRSADCEFFEAKNLKLTTESLAFRSKIIEWVADPAELNAGDQS